MRVLLRCDGGGSLGVGHVMRSLALAEAAVAAGHEVMVAGQLEGSFLTAQLAAAPVEVTQLVASGAVRASLAAQDPATEGGDLQPLIDLVGRFRPEVLHVDSYLASARLRELMVPAAAMVLSDMVLSNMEDGTFGRRPADVVVDPTPGAELSPRPDDGSTWLLRGSRYTPLRQRVLDARGRDGGDAAAGSAGEVPLQNLARSVLVVMGGTDPVGLAPAMVALLARTGLELEVTVIAVRENAGRARAAAAGSRLSLTVLAPVGDLASMMSAHDLVVSAAGTSIWELCCIGVPTAVAWAVDNQRAGYDRIVAAGAAIGLGGPELASAGLGGDELAGAGLGGDEPPGAGLGGDELPGAGLGGEEPSRVGPGADGQSADERAVGLLRRALTDSGLRADLVRAGRDVVDGLGAWRVVQTWEMARRQDSGLGSRPSSPASPMSRSGAPALVARPASMQDALQLWRWRNDPVTRAGSRSSEEVSWQDHLRWLAASLARCDRVLLVVEDPVGGLGTVGTVRWDLEGEGEWEVSITVAPPRRGESLSRPILRAGEVALLQERRSAGRRSGATGPEVSGPEVSGREVSGREVSGPMGAGVTAYLAVVRIDNRASRRLFEASAYIPDLPPDSRGFMQYRKTARVS